MPRYSGSRKQVAHLTFVAPNLGATGGTLLSHGTLGGQEFYMPRRGSIIGFSGSLNAPLTAGTLTFQPTINGSLTPALTSARLHLSAQANYQTLDGETDNYLFSAGQSLGISYTSSDSVAPITTDGVFLLEVLLDDIEY